MEPTNLSETVELFRNPPSQYRGAPFWSWNGRLNPEALSRQIAEMKEAGLGGFFMHARVGLNTRYLGKEWFDCVRHCVAEAEKLDMKAYLYDEDRWPSGAAGGLVTAVDEYRARQIRLVVFDDPAQCQYSPDTVALFRARLHDGRVADAVRLTAVPAALAPGEKLFRINRELMPTSPWFNNTSYLDTLNPDAVAKFIETTYDAYFRATGDRFGKSIPAIFTDEPNFGGVNAAQPDGSRLAPWTDRFAEIFQDRFGYDPAEHLLEIFYPVEGIPYARTALHFMECLTTLFVDNYARQIGTWCEQHHIAFSGHVLCEDTLEQQSTLVGNCMRFYEHMQMPGCDQLTEYWQTFDTAKQVASVAHQLDRRWRLTETYGCTGWHFPFAGHKAVGDWQAVLGINLRCQHLAWYTMQGEAKRDYPAAISHQSPWFRYLSVIEDYFARVNTIFSEGEEQRDILMLHPLESMWMLVGYRTTDSLIGISDNAEISRIDRGFVETRCALLEHQLDFDFGDEELMSRHAAVTATATEPKLRIGVAEYRVVVLPPMLTIRRSTLELLRQFHAQGGRILAVDPEALPRCLDGVEDAAVTAELRAITEGDYLAVLDREFRRVRVADRAGADAQSVLYQLRRRSDGLALMLCNTGFTASLADDGAWEKPNDRRHAIFNFTRALERTRSYPELTVTVAGEPEGEWREFEAETGRIFAVPARCENGQWQFAASLAALQSRIFLLTPKGALPAEPRPETVPVHESAITPAAWELQLEEPNVAVFDAPRWRLDGGAWQEPLLITAIDDHIRTRAGELPRGAAMVQPWAAVRKTKPTTAVELEYEFVCDIIPTAPVTWAMEHPEAAEVRINGVKLNPDPVGHWMDDCLKQLAVPAGTLRRGVNQVTMRLDYDQNCDGLESMFLLGSFGVRMEDTTSVLTELPTRLAPGDWCTMGLPNYSGNALYTTTVNFASTTLRPVLRVPDFGGTALRVLVNGAAAGFILAPPFELDLTGKLAVGMNTLGIEVLGSRRNSHGPFYTGDLYIEWTDATQLKQYKRKERLLMPMGLLTPPSLRLEKEQHNG